LDPIQAAEAKLAQGRTDEAVALLASAGDAGNADALAELATWYLGGNHVARDLATARSLLRRAAGIGHVDAALMEVALTANGSGAAPDWAGALALLRRAAANDPLAAQHLELLGKMALTADGAPASLPAPALLHPSPRIQCFPISARRSSAPISPRSRRPRSSRPRCSIRPAGG
jgi:prolyl 4-hydroxylase